jgi:hypothetical protein
MCVVSLLHLPHHDGSPLFVSHEAPRLGTTVTVRVRTSAADPVDAIWLRTTYDAEPVFHPMSASRDGDTVWWEGGLPVHNPVTHYRFLLVRALADGQGDQEWLTGAGLVGLDLPRGSGLGSRRRRLPGLPRPLRALRGRGRPRDADVGGAGGMGRRRLLRG